LALKKLSVATPGNAPPKPPSAAEKFAEKVSGMPTLKRPVAGFKKLSDQGARWIKILSFGHSGTGKTYFIIGLLLAGETVLVIGTDIGGSGLASVYNYLRKHGLMHLADKLYFKDFMDYEELEEFLKRPEKQFPDIYDIGITWAVWDGFSGFQQVGLQEYVLSFQSQTKAEKVSDGREAGMWAEQQDWGMIRTGTVRPLNRFLNMHNRKDGTAWHKYVTALENKPKEDALSKQTYRGPLVQGSASSIMAPGFDVIFECKVTNKGVGDEGERLYTYNCIGNTGLLAKSRGFDLIAVESADPLAFWQKLKVELGGVAKVEILPDEPEVVEVPTPEEVDNVEPTAA
jgi:hypothetical protein